MNVLVTGENEFASACLCDFGIAKIGEGTASSLPGTPAYMPPEACAGSYGFANDVFAYGVSIWECFSRQTPFAGISDCRDIRDSWLTGTKLNGFQIGDPIIRTLFKQCTEISKDKRVSSDAIVAWYVTNANRKI